MSYIKTITYYHPGCDILLSIYDHCLIQNWALAFHKFLTKAFDSTQEDFAALFINNALQNYFATIFTYSIYKYFHAIANVIHWL